MKPAKLFASLTVLVLAVGATGCATRAGEGALIGGAGGALAGAAIGSHSHGRAGEGALIGGAIGAIGGAIVGSEIDRHESAHYGYDQGGYSGGGYYETGVYVESRPYRPHYHYYRGPVRYYDDCRPRYSYRHGRWHH